MNLPFTARQFIDVFVQYNTGIWPAQVFAYLLGAGAVVFASQKTTYSNRATASILSLFWLWTGIAYHLVYFSGITKGAYIFGALFIVQGILFLHAGWKNRLAFGFPQDGFSISGLLFIAYAMAFYPIVSSMLGHGFPRSPAFGVAPCPVTIFTFGLLLLAGKKVPGYLLAIPLLWSFIGFNAALHFGILEDIGLLVAGVAGTALIFWKNHRLP